MKRNKMFQGGIKYMTNEQIDILINSVEKGNYEQFVELCTDNELREKILNNYDFKEFSLDDDIKENLFSNIMGQIESEGFEYFISKLQTHPDFASLLESLKDETKIRECIERRVELKLNNDVVVQLISISKDAEYKKMVIEGKVPGLEVYFWDKLKLIGTMDEEYIKAAVEDRIPEIWLTNWDKLKLVENMSETYKKDIIEGRVPRVKFSKFEKIFFMDEEAKKAAIEERDPEVKFDIWDKLKLLDTMGEEYKKAVIEDKIPTFLIDEHNKINLLRTMGEEYKRAVLEDKIPGLRLANGYKLRLIETLGEKYRKAAIEGKISGLYLDSDSKLELLKDTDVEYRRLAVEGKIAGLELDNESKARIISGMRLECRKSALKGEIEVPVEVIESVILRSGDADFIKMMLDDKEIEVGDEFRERLRNILLALKVNELNIEPNIEFTLPKEMTIGMEIENEGESSEILMNSFEFGKWSAKGDGSLRDGVEIISPILKPTKECAEEIYKVTKALNMLEQGVSERCGGHIHIGADYLTSTQAYANFMEIWCNTEQILYTVSNEKSETPRDGVDEYAVPFTGKLQRALEDGVLQLNDEKELDKFVEELKTVQGSRYSGMNLLNVNNGKNTIEFRLANGTLNPEMWMDNINLFGGIVAVSEELTVTQDKRKTAMFSKLKEDISNEEKLSILLELVGVEPERYVERYSANIGLIKNTELGQKFSEMNGPTQITLQKIAEMTSEVSAVAQQEAMQSIIKEMERSRENSNEMLK